GGDSVLIGQRPESQRGTVNLDFKVPASGNSKPAATASLGNELPIREERITPSNTNSPNIHQGRRQQTTILSADGWIKTSALGARLPSLDAQKSDTVTQALDTNSVDKNARKESNAARPTTSNRDIAAATIASNRSLRSEQISTTAVSSDIRAEVAPIRINTVADSVHERSLHNVNLEQRKTIGAITSVGTAQLHREPEAVQPRLPVSDFVNRTVVATRSPGVESSATQEQARGLNASATNNLRTAASSVQLVTAPSTPTIAEELLIAAPDRSVMMGNEKTDVGALANPFKTHADVKVARTVDDIELSKTNATTVGVTKLPRTMPQTTSLAANGFEENVLSGAELSVDLSSEKPLASNVAPLSSSARTPAASPTFDLKFSDANFQQNFNEKIFLMAAQGSQKAFLSLNPQDLGQVNIKLTVTQNEVSVQMASTNGLVRESLEQGMPRLREMFENAGLKLIDHQVANEFGGQRHAEQFLPPRQRFDYAPPQNSEGDLVSDLPRYERTHDGRIDTFV
ncbi:MAG: flagellar hook-length control protein FliK, partial [Pseudomonadota bacterium]